MKNRTSPGVFHDMALLGLCLEFSFNILYCRTQANPPTLLCKHKQLKSLLVQTENNLNVPFGSNTFFCNLDVSTGIANVNIRSCLRSCQRKTEKVSKIKTG